MEFSSFARKTFSSDPKIFYTGFCVFFCLLRFSLFLSLFLLLGVFLLVICWRCVLFFHCFTQIIRMLWRASLFHSIRQSFGVSFSPQCSISRSASHSFSLWAGIRSSKPLVRFILYFEFHWTMCMDFNFRKEWVNKMERAQASERQRGKKETEKRATN